jgi:SAM-dependent methyltransferase
MQTEKYYDKKFYTSEDRDVLLQSPRAVVPLVITLVSPSSVVDVGCGPGAWLNIFREQGVERILGIEGTHVDSTWLLIPKENVRKMDISKPFRLAETFDLAVCLEVAEHLPKRYAEGLVESLVSLAPIILFSAAVPLQGGVHHVNEQWPQYWAKFFLRHRYRQLDVIRRHIWKNGAIESFYRQNMFLYVREDLVGTRQEFIEALGDSDDLMLVHQSTIAAQIGLRSILKNLPKSVWEFVIRRGQRLRM